MFRVYLGLVLYVFRDCLRCIWGLYGLVKCCYSMFGRFVFRVNQGLANGFVVFLGVLDVYSGFVSGLFRVG